MMVEKLLSDWGLPALFAGTFFEGETAAILGGMVAHRGLHPWPMTALVAMLGAVAADQMWFLLSRRFLAGGTPEEVAPEMANTGAGVVAWIRRKLSHLGESSGARWVQRHVAAHPVLVALLYRYIPGTRILGPVLLAQTAMRWPVFLALNLTASALWAVIFTGIGYHSGSAAESILGRLQGHHFGLVLLAVASAGIGLHLWVRRRPKA